MLWFGWPLDRVILLLVGLGYLLVALQVWLYHSRQNFRHFAMWGPVIVGPLLGAVLLLLTLTGAEAFLAPGQILLWTAVASGVIGFVYHLRGVGLRVDGYVLRNFMIGPPVILPLLFSALGVIGLVAAYWR